VDYQTQEVWGGFWGLRRIQHKDCDNDAPKPKDIGHDLYPVHRFLSPARIPNDDDAIPCIRLQETNPATPKIQIVDVDYYQCFFGGTERRTPLHPKRVKQSQMQNPAGGDGWGSTRPMYSGAPQGQCTSDVVASRDVMGLGDDTRPATDSIGRSRRFCSCVKVGHYQFQTTGCVRFNPPLKADM